MQNFPRLTSLFGCRIDQLDENAIRAAIAGHAPEGPDLDFKRTHHDNSDELAKDVAAFANSAGGVLVIGVAEDKGSASHANSVDISDPCMRHITQVMASRIEPFIHGVELRAIPIAHVRGSGFLAIIVPRSSQAPHAVVDPQAGTLRYPVRAGTTTRWLSEHEVSTNYADRFQARSGAESRLDEVHREGLGRIAGWRSPWLAVSVVPIVLGERGVGSERVAAEMHFTHSVWSPVPTSPFRYGGRELGRYHARLGRQCERKASQESATNSQDRCGLAGTAVRLLFLGRGVSRM
jgi:Putative DNA-binding domain